MVFSKPDMEKSDDLSKARKKVADLHAQRSHSESEMRKKLARSFIPALVEKMIVEAKKRGWLPSNEAEESSLAEMIAEKLHRSRKGVHWINQKLQASGLPPVPADPKFELEKAMEQARKIRASRWSGKNPTARVIQSLRSKGFDQDIIHRVLDNLNLKNPDESFEEEF